MGQAYGYIGWTQFWGGLFAYYVVANDFGFPPASLQFIANADLVVPKTTDVYNPTSPTFGNSNLNTVSCSNNMEMIDWIYNLHGAYDLRLAAVECHIIGGNPVYSHIIDFGACNIQQISPATNLPACYTT
jgi:hypothetical protein